MNITYYNNTSTLVEYNGIKVLFDPWLIGKAYYGSWTSYPELNLDINNFKDIDYIHISHIHPDHCHDETLKCLPDNIPILIHNWDDKFVKGKLERMGKKVIELEHGKKFNLGENFNLYVYAADDCNPEECFKFLGCGKIGSPNKSVGIDTFSVLETPDNNIVQLNDTPYPLSTKIMHKVKSTFKNIDLLMVGYTGAGSYPQCWSNYTDEDKIKKYGEIKRQKFLNWGVGFLNILKPKYYMPYAGTYTLCGSLGKLEKFKVTPELPEALNYYKNNYKEGKGFLLNPNQTFYLNKGTQSSPYCHYDIEEKYKFIDKILSKEKFDYEYDDNVSLKQIIELLPMAYQRYDQKRKELNFKTDTNVYIHLVENKILKISPKNYSIIDKKDFKDTQYVTYKIHPKLLYRILKGPKYAHWNNAEIGSHIEFTRYPEIYERKLYYLTNFFHA
jgi:UDP-MurNAc hydroxylase